MNPQSPKCPNPNCKDGEVTQYSGGKPYSRPCVDCQAPKQATEKEKDSSMTHATAESDSHMVGNNAVEVLGQVSSTGGCIWTGSFMKPTIPERFRDKSVKVTIELTGSPLPKDGSNHSKPLVSQKTEPPTPTQGAGQYMNVMGEIIDRHTEETLIDVYANDETDSLADIATKVANAAYAAGTASSPPDGLREAAKELLADSFPFKERMDNLAAALNNSPSPSPESGGDCDCGCDTPNDCMCPPPDSDGLAKHFAAIPKPESSEGGLGAVELLDDVRTMYETAGMIEKKTNDSFAVASFMFRSTKEMLQRHDLTTKDGSPLPKDPEVMTQATEQSDGLAHESGAEE